MQLTTGTRRTASLTAPLSFSTEANQAGPVLAHEDLQDLVFWLAETDWWALAGASAKRPTYNAQLLLKSRDVWSVVSAVAGRISFIDVLQSEPFTFNCREMRSLRRDPFSEDPNSVQIAAWLTAIAGCEAPTALPQRDMGFEDLDEVVNAIRNRTPVKVSSEVEALIQRAAKQEESTPSGEDLHSWARRVAEDVGDLTD